jgi:hypothetical protein
MKKNILKIILINFFLVVASSCGTQKEVVNISDEEKAIFENGAEEPVKIADEESEYEIIILEPGFNVWLQSIARPEWYYSQSFLESRNQILVTNWNIRVDQPQLFDPNLYQMRIDYSPHIDYGLEVNYKLYNYFIFFQRRFNQRLSGFIPRI